VSGAPLWTSDAAAAATAGQLAGPGWAATGVSIDSRTLVPGDLFVALSAARDGHDFVAQALDRGAAAAMVSRRPDGVAAGAPLLVVPDVAAALTALGAAGRARSRARVIAVTGSVGKTSAKEMLRCMLGAQMSVHAAEASYNNHWGVPLTLARLPQDAAAAVIEIGMNSPGEIAPLSRLARPHVALVTTIASAHLEALGSLDGIAAEKAEIVAGLETGGVAVLPAGLAQSQILEDRARAAGLRILRFGTEPGAAWRLAGLRIAGGLLVAEVEGPEGPMVLRLATPGRHFGELALGALAAAHAAGADCARAALALAAWAPPGGRGGWARIRLDPVEDLGFDLIDDAFNANPASLAAALSTLAEASPGPGARRIAILGDMLELGGDAEALHAALADLPAMARIDVVHVAGPLMGALWQALPHTRRGRRAASAEELADNLRRVVHPGDVVLVKGSKGSRVARLVDLLRDLGQGDGAARHDG